MRLAQSSTLRPRRRLRTAAALVAAIGALAFSTTACSGHGGSAAPTIVSSSQSSKSASASPAPAADSSLSPSPSPSPVASTPAATGGLSAQQLAGQRVVYSYPGLVPPAALLQAIRSGEAAGVIFFGRNISSEAQLSGAIAQLVAAQRQSPVAEPLLLMTDQEGGEVRRLPGGPTLSEKQIGESSDPVTAAAQAGTAAAQNLAGVGMNVNLAPVIDVFYAAGDFDDQYQRSYSSDPAAVAQLGAAFITAQQQAGVAATAKHFPGLGSATASEDTDTGPVTLPVPLSQLRGTDEVPYQSAIAAGVKLVMVSWAIYPALDPSHPAGLSSAVVQGELRERLGFTGVTITDALEAGALAAYGTPGQRAVDAAQAGMDLILCSSGSVSQGEDATSALAAALQSGQLDASTFNAAVDRVSALRSNL
jgi:beta-N-acetylhexosaminidase